MPTLRLKLISTTVMGALMGVAGAPFALSHVSYVDPVSAFNLFIAVNAIAMPMIGGTTAWARAGDRRAAARHACSRSSTVTISSELNLLIVGVMLVLFVIAGAARASSGWCRSGSESEAQVMTAPLLEGRPAWSKRFGGFVALDAIDLHVGAGERLGLIGPNGSGKTTMINCISGALVNDEGDDRLRRPRHHGMPPHKRTRLGIARSFQIPRPFGSMTVLENLRVPLEYAGAPRLGGHIDDEARDIEVS